MPQPRGQKRIPGHQYRTAEKRVACECGWTAPAERSTSAQLVLRGRHLVDVRMAAAE
jgi:hypothetical protein